MASSTAAASTSSIEPVAPKEAPDRRGDTVGRAYARLREMIISGTYHPGQRLTQTELTDELGIGRTPLREALRMLEADGYLVSIANRGVTVSAIELGSTEELYAARLLLEPPLISSLAGNFTCDEIDLMEESLGGMERTSTRRSDFQEQHRLFHQVAVGRYGPAIEELVMGLYRRIVWSQRVYMTQPRVTDDFIKLDRQLLDAIRAHDGELAKQLLEFHLIDAALGLVLAVEPDHQFNALPNAASGLGIRMTFPEIGNSAPVELGWPNGRPDLVGLETSNARCVPFSAPAA
jgi:DNA-binding GntR family transcriptional regulator